MTKGFWTGGTETARWESCHGAPYALLFEKHPQPMWLHDPETLAIQAVNEAAIRQYGYSREEFFVMTLRDLHVQGDSDSVGEPASGAPLADTQTRTWKHRKKDGEAIDVRLLSQPIPTEAGPARLTMATDITPFKRLEELHEMLLEAIPSSVLLVDRHLKVVLANKNFLEKGRRSRGNTLGRPLKEVFPEVILNEMELDRQILQVFQSFDAVQGQRMTYRAPGLPTRIYYYSIIPVVRGRSVESAILLMDDITKQTRLSEEIRRIERHLAGVVQSANDAVLSTDTKGRILTWNTAAEKISGYSFDEVRDRFFFELCATDHRDKARALFSRIRRPLESPHMAEWDLETKEGNLIPMSWVFSTMKDDIGQSVAGVVAVGRDLTERRKFEMQLFQSQKLAALGVMAGGIAHEIRNPLAIAASASQFLMEDEVTIDFQKECAEKINQGIKRASAIIENLLKIAHPDPASRTYLAEVDLISVLNEVLKLIDNQTRLQKIEVVAKFPKAPVRIQGIASLLEQLFMNLFLNALQAMQTGGALRVAVKTGSHEVQVIVADTGPGISKAALENIFDPFYTTSPVGKGTGLGLSICYSIVKQHAGSIEVESRPGEGTTFTVKLPLP